MQRVFRSKHRGPLSLQGEFDELWPSFRPRVNSAKNTVKNFNDNHFIGSIKHMNQNIIHFTAIAATNTERIAVFTQVCY